MSDGQFDGFTIKAKPSPDAVGYLLTIGNELEEPSATINADELTLTCDDFAANNDTLVEILGKYASHMEDSEAFHADTDGSGDWFWRIKDGRYQETGAILQPIEKE